MATAKPIRNALSESQRTKIINALTVDPIKKAIQNRFQTIDPRSRLEASGPSLNDYPSSSPRISSRTSSATASSEGSWIYIMCPDS